MSTLARLLPLFLALCLAAAPLGTMQAGAHCRGHDGAEAASSSVAHAHGATGAQAQESAHHAAHAVDDAPGAPSPACDCGCACGLAGCVATTPALPSGVARTLAPEAPGFARLRPVLRPLAAHSPDLIRPPAAC